MGRVGDFLGRKAAAAVDRYLMGGTLLKQAYLSPNPAPRWCADSP
jgi:hypothetical protein